MKKTFLFCLVAGIVGLCSCEKMEGGLQQSADKTEISFVNAAFVTKGYVDGVRFYERAVATLHDSGVEPTARTMRVSAYLNPQEGTPSNYFVDELFESNGVADPGEKWVHTPALYWPLGGNMDFLAYTSSNPFENNDVHWSDANAASGLTLAFDASRTQDDVLYACAKASSADASSNETQVYTIGKAISIEFQHAQAWLEFQLSVADNTMKDKIAIKEIIVDNAYNQGVLRLTRNSISSPVVEAKWECDGKKQFRFDDSYGVYGAMKGAEDYPEEYAAVTAAQAELETAQAGGDFATIQAAQAALAAAQAALDAKVKEYNLKNAINIVGNNGSSGGNCVFMDMLLPAQAKSSFIIRYVLAGNPQVLEYRFSPKNSGSDKWDMGKKYIYDIDFVVSEITFQPTVKEYEVSFDGVTNPIEIN